MVGAVGAEQRGLGGEVGLDIAVQVEVIVTQHREGGGGEPGALDPAHGQGVRRHLHGDHLDAVVAPASEAGLELGSIGRRRRTAGHGGERPDDLAAATGRLGDGADEGDGGGLAVGAGDADDGQVAAGVAPEAGGEWTHGEAHRGHDHLGDVDVDPVLDQQSGGTGLHGVAGELVAVDPRAGDAAEQRARADLAAVVGDGRDVGVAGAVEVDPGVRETADGIGQPHQREAPVTGGMRNRLSANLARSAKTGAAAEPP